MSDWTLVSEHRPTPEGLVQTTWPFLLLGTFTFFFGIMLQFVRTKAGEETATRIAGIVALIGSVPLLGVAPWRFFQGPTSVRVHKEGLEWRKDGREHRRTWADVTEVYRTEIHMLQAGARPNDWNRRTELRLVFADGSEARFNHVLSNYNQLIGFVQKATTEHLLPRAREALHIGGVAFGAIRLTREGLSVGRDVFPFGALNQFYVGNGHLGWVDMGCFKHTFALKDLPNYMVLLTLLEEMRREAGALTESRL
jgi:hypothetical protein